MLFLVTGETIVQQQEMLSMRYLHRYDRAIFTIFQDTQVSSRALPTKLWRIVSREILWYDKRKIAGHEGASRPHIPGKRVQGW
jgi:hypothetical protein